MFTARHVQRPFLQTNLGDGLIVYGIKRVPIFRGLYTSLLERGGYSLRFLSS